MEKISTVRELARGALTVHSPTCESDDSLWERAERLVRSVELICGLDEIMKKDLAVDKFCLIAATYFSDAGLARHIERCGCGVKLATVEDNEERLMDLCGEVLEEVLGPFVSEGQLSKIRTIISESGERFTDRPEAIILSDARNLDDMGLVGFVNELRRYVVDGKGISTALKCWKRKIDYRYWQARLREGFRFETVQRIAEKRVERAEKCIEQLRDEASCEDIRQFSEQQKARY